MKREMMPHVISNNHFISGSKFPIFKSGKKFFASHGFPETLVVKYFTVKIKEISWLFVTDPHGKLHEPLFVRGPSVWNHCSRAEVFM